MHASMRLTSWSLLLVVVVFFSVALCSCSNKKTFLGDSKDKESYLI